MRFGLWAVFRNSCQPCGYFFFLKTLFWFSVTQQDQPFRQEQGRLETASIYRPVMMLNGVLLRATSLVEGRSLRAAANCRRFIGVRPAVLTSALRLSLPGKH